MKIVFLGTNGWYDTATGNTICIFAETDDYIIILDAGNGLYKLNKYSGIKKPAYIFLSHFHLDHLIGFHILNKFKFFKGLTICGPTGTKRILNNIINAPFTISLDKLEFETSIFELPHDERYLPFKVVSMPLLHSSLTLGFRFEIDGKILSYCPDTGFCKNAVILAKNSDLLIADCAFKSGQEDKNWPHLNPETAAKIAKESNSKMLALVHFDAEIYSILEDRYKAEDGAKKFFAKTVATFDQMEIEI
ncbi:MBL fold metallo-hydrolase [Candidatus Methanoperedens nitratireducens]|uniref:Seceted metal-dependent hydrolase of the beta-lactamase superfamily III n=1 Tax=Candidatus Methanoperedens nitratireducens TaxID=1392998 RepID=A0A284VUM4_9EURY